MHHKRRKPKRLRAGCLMCKPWKMNGFGESKQEGAEAHSDRVRRDMADKQLMESGG